MKDNKKPNRSHGRYQKSVETIVYILSAKSPTMLFIEPSLKRSPQITATPNNFLENLPESKKRRSLNINTSRPSRNGHFPLYLHLTMLHPVADPSNSSQCHHRHDLRKQQQHQSLLQKTSMAQQQQHLMLLHLIVS